MTGEINDTSLKYCTGTGGRHTLTSSPVFFHLSGTSVCAPQGHKEKAPASGHLLLSQPYSAMPETPPKLKPNGKKQTFVLSHIWKLYLFICFLRSQVTDIGIIVDRLRKEENHQNGCLHLCPCPMSKHSITYSQIILDQWTFVSTQRKYHSWKLWEVMEVLQWWALGLLWRWMATWSLENLV